MSPIHVWWLYLLIGRYDTMSISGNPTGSIVFDDHHTRLRVLLLINGLGQWRTEVESQTELYLNDGIGNVKIENVVVRELLARYLLKGSFGAVPSVQGSFIDPVRI